MNKKSEFIEPYKPSIIHKIYDWIDRLPGPYWLPSIVFLVVTGLLNNIVAWRAHKLAFGEINWNYALTGFFFCYFFVATDFLLRVAKSVALEFLTVLDVDETKCRLILFEFTHLPVGTSGLFFVLGAMIGLFMAINLLPTAPDINQAFPVLELTMYSISFGMAFITLYLILRAARLIDRLFKESVNIDIFDQTSLYAISRYSAWLIIVFAIANFFEFVLIPSFNTIPVASLPLNMVYWLAAVIMFWLPLRGVNRKLVSEKRRYVKEVNFRIKANFDLLHSKMDNDEYKNIADIREMIATLQLERENIKSISTWPWRAGTLSGLLTAIVLPILGSFLIDLVNKFIK
jgi:hypothetical protein